MLLEARRKANRLGRRFDPAGKAGSLAILIFAEIAVLSLWFSSTAVLPEMAAESGVLAGDLAWLSTAAAGKQSRFEALLVRPWPVCIPSA
jgi:hypothetical protein